MCNWMRLWLSIWAAGLAVVGSAAGVAAQSADAVAEARAQLEYEPGVSEVTRETLRYFRVDPDSFDSLRRAARLRAILPLVAAGYRYDDNAFVRFEEQMISEPRTNDENTNTNNHAATIGAVWDLRSLVFNPAEVQVYGLIGVQRDLMLEVTRTFYLRRQLMLRFMLRPPDDPLARSALQLRIDEFTSILDVLTGGWFSRESSGRRAGADIAAVAGRAWSCARASIEIDPLGGGRFAAEGCGQEGVFQCSTSNGQTSCAPAPD